ncbi:hypothetical protein SAMN04488094_105223 [Tropicimonas isoalkanivorans]|uniref:Uncharacterized protein n=1 Tax=Tropicimonas isoalkanivorans TaxID=441112 RepID=A0A1I1JQU2_9RHOB|nr:hypothetical protein SAMN04488094_105223 [Tropicimonas isoalkanivorans]
MCVVKSLEKSVQAFEVVPTGARIFAMKSDFKGPGGTWRGGLWYVGFKRIRAVLIPDDGGRPVALTGEWTRSQPATAMAETFARMAAGVELEEV